jgi:dUTP pyrophosphatase
LSKPDSQKAAPAAPADRNASYNSPLSIRLMRLEGGEGLSVPSPATPGSAGCDLQAAIHEDVVLQPGQRELIPTGFAIALPDGFEAQVRPRSGLALRHGITVPNAPGTIDADYRGQIQVILMNLSDAPFPIHRGDRIAQLVVAPVMAVHFEEVPDLDETLRGEGGFGSTGKGKPR